jgi:hypothetical protein
MGFSIAPGAKWDAAHRRCGRGAASCRGQRYKSPRRLRDDLERPAPFAHEVVGLHDHRRPGFELGFGAADDGPEARLDRRAIAAPRDLQVEANVFDGQSTRCVPCGEAVIVSRRNTTSSAIMARSYLYPSGT